MKRKVNFRFIAALIFSVLAITSCISEEDFTGPVASQEGTSEVSFIAGLPSLASVATRSETGAVAENTINDIYVLVFETGSGDLVTKARGKNISIASGANNNNKITFKATLPVGRNYTFMVLANAAEYLAGIDVGMNPAKTKSDVLSLVVTQTGKWSSTSKAIPMWDEQEMTLTSNSTPSFELTRMLARINVDVNLRDDDKGQPQDNFKLTSVRYYNYNTAGALVPDRANYDSSIPAVTDPTMPAAPGTQLGQALTYSGAEIEDEKSCLETIYVFEAKHNGKGYDNSGSGDEWIDNACLVIGGKFRTKEGQWLEETFYRVDFIRKDATDPNNIKDNWLSILRNFSYNVNIVDVSGSGFVDPDQALRSAPINMEAKVLEWNETDMGEIVFDGVFYLSVSQDKFVVERGEVTTEIEEYSLYVKTDYVHDNNPNSATSGWQVEKYVDAADGVTDVTWLTLDPDRGSPDDRVKAYIKFEANPYNVNRTAIIWIKAGRLRYPVYVTQRVLSLYITDPEDGGNQVERMEFVVPRSGDMTHPKRYFTVDWTPLDFDVNIVQNSTQHWTPFEPSYISPDPSAGVGAPATPWTIKGGLGTQTFGVQPPAASASDIELNPFYEKESTYDFTINNGGDSETKSITLHQIYYNIVVDTYGYNLDGRTYTMSVRSNCKWKISKIEEWLYNEDPEVTSYPQPVMLRLNDYDNLKVGTSGGPNVSGESVSFTVVDRNEALHTSKWGVVYVTFESVDGKCPAVRAALRFPPDKLHIMGLGYVVNECGYSIGNPSLYHDNNSFSMLTTSKNFGDTAESTVYVRNMKVSGYNCPGTSVTNPGLTGWSTAYFRSWLNENPDVLVISYSTRPNAAEVNMINEYINNGGFAILMIGGYDDELGAAAQRLLRVLLDDTGLTAGKVTNGSNDTDVYYISDDPKWDDDPVFGGPFGNMRDKHWGAHQRSVGFLPSRQDIYDEIEILTLADDNVYQIYGGTASNPHPDSRKNHIVFFRHKTKNLIWLGCDAFMAAWERDKWVSGSKYLHPFNLYPDRTPTFRPDFGKQASSFQKYDVYNSYIVANMVAYAIGRTNHIPPENGY